MLYHIFAYSICIALSFITAKATDQEVFQLSPELILRVQKIALPCIEEHQADPKILQKLLDGTMSSDDSTKKFVYCFSVKGNFTDEEGHFNVARMSSIIGNHPLVKPFEEALEECNKITKESPVETAYAMSFCLNNNAPVVFAL